MRAFEWLGTAVVAGMLVVGVTAAWGAGFNLNFGATDEAGARDVGLPYYPGARLHKGGKDDDNSAKVWGSFGPYGMKIAAVDLESNDQPGRIVPFYLSALRKYGPVLDCSPGRPYPPKADKHSGRLDCSDDHPKPGSFVFKVGVKEDFHIVSIEPQNHGSRIALVAIQTRGLH